MDVDDILAKKLVFPLYPIATILILLKPYLSTSIVSYTFIIC